MTDDSETQRRLRSKIGGLYLHLYGNSKEIAARARAGFDERFYREAREIKPDASPAEIEKTVGILRKIHFAKLTLKSSKTRQQKKNRQDGQNKLIQGENDDSSPKKK